MRFIKTILSIAAFALLVGCASSGPPYAEVAAYILPVPADKGRIYFYRADTYLGSGLTGNVYLNDRVVGKSERAGFFFVDEKPGTCSTWTDSGDERKVTFTLAAGETKYVQTAVVVGAWKGSLIPQIMYPEQGKTEITTLRYNGAPLSGGQTKK